jgi:hypothetical protein
MATEPMCPNDRMIVCGTANCPFTLFVSDSMNWQRYDYILPVTPMFGPDGMFLVCPNGNKAAGVFMEGDKVVQRSC